ncbi:SRPBCC domain-containing protein [Streptomyces sp. NPDC048718]|uniref:SRPBCC domain-containing protein n=1 Tax=Streptomyces sp. NPDC048718 TaxID=3365587 RepID=UPI00371BF51D
MEHEVYVPVPAEVLRATLADPARLARCVPGFQQDADAASGPLTGRLKVRVGGNTITYRGTWRVTGRPGGFAVAGEGTEVRGKGTVTCGITLTLGPASGGTLLGFTGSVTATGRLADAGEEARNTAGARLLGRFAEALAAVADVEAELAAEDMAEGPAKTTAEDAHETAPGETGHANADTEADNKATADAADATDDDGVDDGAEEPGGRPSVFDTPVPPPSLDPRADAEFDRDSGKGTGQDRDKDTGKDRDKGKAVDGTPSAEPGGPSKNGSSREGAPKNGKRDEAASGRGTRQPAEAAHARRTMIGRSAEEVDHAPPRGRYAPMPAAEASHAAATLRWIAPAAALAVASAVVVHRALRRRR